MQTPATRHQEKFIAQLAGELADTDYAADANAFLASAGINLDTRPRLIGISAARLGGDDAATLISRLLRLRAAAAAVEARG